MITLRDEPAPNGDPITIFDPDAVWKKKRLSNYTAKELLVKIFDKGKCVYKTPSLKEIQDHCTEQLDTLWGTMLRFDNPQKYYVDLSNSLWNLKHELLHKYNAE